MKSFIVSLIFCICSLSIGFPTSIVGKWIVEKADFATNASRLTDQEKATMRRRLMDPFINSIFEFMPDHDFYLSANLNGMPKGDFWGYDEKQGEIIIREQSDPKSAVMRIEIVEKDDDIYFALEDTNVILKVIRRS